MKKDYYGQGDRTYSITIKLIVISFLLFVFGCETTQTSVQKTVHPKTIRNPKCEDVYSFKVFQVLDKYILADVCLDNDYLGRMGHTVCFQKEKGKIYYDDQIIKVNENECAIYIGTYQYQTRGGYKTVPIVKIIDSRIAQPE